MLTLTLCRGEFYRVKDGQTEKEILNAFNCPLKDDVYPGAIIRISPLPYKKYQVKVGENYNGIASKFGVDTVALSTLNENKRLFPGCVIYIPLGEV